MSKPTSGQSNLMPPIIYPPGKEPKTTQAPVVSSGGEISNLQLGHDPKFITCPKCGKNVTTKVEYLASQKMRNTASFNGLVGGDDCCYMFLFSCSSIKNAHHYCPSCKELLGVYSSKKN